MKIMVSAHTSVKPSIRAAISRIVFCLLLGAALYPQGTYAAKWDTIAPADLSAKDSTAFPGADAEILFSKREISEKGDEQIGYAKVEGFSAVYNSVRAKIYTAKGVQDQGKLYIRNSDNVRVEGVRARVVKPDGKFVELKKEDIISNLDAKDKDGTKWKKTTFVFPGLEPGDVVEYKWAEVSSEELWLDSFYVQQPVPVREFRFTVSSMTRRGMINWLNCPNVTTSDKDGYTVVMHNLPAFEEEEFMPPQSEQRSLVYLAKYYTEYPTDKEVWKYLTQAWADEFRDQTRPSSPVKTKALTLVEGAATHDEKLRRIYEFCQGEIYNTTYWKNAQLQSEIVSHKNEEANSPAKVLSKGHGRKDEIDNLFAAMARALGYEVKLARSPSRLFLWNIKISAGWAFLDRRNVAVKVDDEWRYFSPGSYFVPYGMMAFRDERAPALLCDSDKMDFGLIGFSSADKSQVLRKARLTLDSEGTLEGDVEETFTGQEAILRKEDYHGDEVDKVNENFKKGLNLRLPSAEISDLVWANLITNVMPLTVKYHVKVPGYAQQAGKRLIFSPSYFQFGKVPVLAPEQRKYPIAFPFISSEHDDIELKLPEGYTLDKPSAPSPVGSLASAFGAEYQLNYKPKIRTFIYRRDFVLGGNGVCAFRLESYPELRALFAGLQKSDTHSIILKPKVAAAPAGEVTPPAAAEPAAQSEASGQK